VRAWDPKARKHKTETYDSRDKAEEAGRRMVAAFLLGTDSAESAKVDAVWKSYCEENYGITADQAEAMHNAPGGSGNAAAALGKRLKVNWRTIHSMVGVIHCMRDAKITDLKDKAFRSKMTKMFNDLKLQRSKSEDGRVAVSTKERMLVQVRSLVNHARNAGWLLHNPLAGFRVTGNSEQSDIGREVFTLDECRKLAALQRYDDPIWVHAMLMLYGGMRDAEAQAVTWQNYEPDRRLLWVRKGKGNKVRAIPVQAELGEILAKVDATTGPKAKNASFPTAPIVRVVAGRCVSRWTNWQELLNDAGITLSRGVDQITGMQRTLCRHSCRHTFAALMLASGEDGTALRLTMGHANVDMTSHYAGQRAMFLAEIEREGWQRGQLRLLPQTAAQAAANA
jgi:integrase/recombinase XerD